MPRLKCNNERTSMQYILQFDGFKSEHVQLKRDIFLSFAQNLNCQNRLIEAIIMSIFCTDTLQLRAKPKLCTPMQT